MDAVVIVSIGAGLYALHAWNALSGTRAVLALGVAYTVSAVVGHLITDFRYTVDWVKLRRTFQETWTYSRWALVGVVAAAVQSSGYVYVVSLVQDLTITADVSAARTLMMPYLLLVSSSQRIFLSKASQIRSTHGESRFLRFILFFALFFIGVWSVYVPLLVLFQEKLIVLVYTEKYIRINVYILYWAVLSLLVAARFITSYSLQAYKDFKHLALYGSVSAALTITLCVLFLFLFGSVGALVALIIGESVLLGLSISRMVTFLRPGGGGGISGRLRESAGDR
jgi:O-antigen/teichoic acid export membrane protein